MSDVETKLRLNTVNHEAKRLGYRIAVELLLPVQRTKAYRVFAYPDDGDSAGRFLCGSTSAPVDAAEEGLAVLRGIVEGGQSWPDGSKP
jgi:hypothetical protein